MAKEKGHRCNPPSLGRSSKDVDIVRWNCPGCGRRFEKRYGVK